MDLRTAHSPLSNWPRYPGGAVSGAVIATVSVVTFFTDSALQYLAPAALIAVALAHKPRTR